MQSSSSLPSHIWVSSTASASFTNSDGTCLIMPSTQACTVSRGCGQVGGKSLPKPGLDEAAAAEAVSALQGASLQVCSCPSCLLLSCTPALSILLYMTTPAALSCLAHEPLAGR
jgi:hypothetical protein